jgi:hypothetical protein
MKTITNMSANQPSWNMAPHNPREGLATNNAHTHTHTHTHIFEKRASIKVGYKCHYIIMHHPRSRDPDFTAFEWRSSRVVVWISCRDMPISQLHTSAIEKFDSDEGWIWRACTELGSRKRTTFMRHRHHKAPPENLLLHNKGVKR